MRTIAEIIEDIWNVQKMELSCKALFDNKSNNRQAYRTDVDDVFISFIEFCDF